MEDNKIVISIEDVTLVQPDSTVIKMRPREVEPTSNNLQRYFREHEKLNSTN